MEEYWRDVPDYEGLYQVSNKGRVRSLTRYVGTQYGRKRIIKGIIITPTLERTGYFRVGLNKNCTHKMFSIHRLVATAFIPNPNNYLVVNHKDENKQNNFVWVNEDGTVDFEKSNLEWCSFEYNNNYGTKNYRISQSLINNVHKSKIVLQFDFQGTFIKEWPSVNEIYRSLGVKPATINRCCRGVKHHHTAFGYIWKYKRGTV